MRGNLKLICSVAVISSIFLGSYYYNVSSKNTEINKLKKEISTLEVKTATNLNNLTNTEDLLDKEFIDEEKFKWASIKDWDMIRITNPITKDILEIKDVNITATINLYDRLYPLKYRFAPSAITPENVQPYEYEFVKNNRSYKMQVVGYNLVKIEDSYYITNNNIGGLGDAFLPYPPYLKVDNIFGKIYYSGMYKFNDDLPSFDKRHINLFAEYFFQDSLEDLKSLPKGNIKLAGTLRFYFHNEEITLNLYEDTNKIQYIELQDSSTTVYFKQLHSQHSIFNILGI